MIKALSLAPIILGLIACATGPKLSKELTFERLKSLRFGYDRAERVKTLFGSPSKVTPLPNFQDLWIYKGESTLSTLTIDRVEGRVLSAVTMLNETSDLHSLDAALAYFKSSKFSIKEVDSIDRHEMSNEADYLDPNSGILLRVNKQNRTVSMVGLLEVPPRKPANQN